MIEPVEFIAAIEKLDIRFVTGVPDSLLKNVCACLSSSLPPGRHVIATNEGSAVGLAIGHYLATGRPALVYMQNSGIGNTVNPVASLADPHVYGVPMVFMIGWRGEILAGGRQCRDEPQHVKQGQITLSQLEILDIPYRIVGGHTHVAEPILCELVDLAIARSGPAALVVRQQTFAPFEPPQVANRKDRLSREAAIAAILDALPETATIVATTGLASRELFALRETSGAGHHKDFLTVGGMGHASQIAAGIAIAKPSGPVVCIDGDGALFMHMGSLAIGADCANLLHIVMNNGAYDSVGGQPTKGAVLELTRIAAACGYARTICVNTRSEIAAAIQKGLKTDFSSFIEIKCAKGARLDLGRPDQTPAQNKIGFMQYLQGTHAKKAPDH
jgi:phosphonopyruvate decarboxylase